MRKFNKKSIIVLVLFALLGSVAYYYGHKKRPSAPPAIKVHDALPPENPTVKAWSYQEAKVCGTNLDIDTPFEPMLEALGADFGLDYLESFANVVQWLNLHGKLPDCYHSKDEAYAKGWNGGPLWRYLEEGSAIGGSFFDNREGLLPSRYNGRYQSADIDYNGKKRGPERLVFVENTQGAWLIWLSVDHYANFQRLDPTTLKQ